MAGHTQFMLPTQSHYMCATCWVGLYGESQPPATQIGEHTTDHCCWCGQLHSSGIYWSDKEYGGEYTADPVCGNHAGCHPIMGDAPEFYFDWNEFEDDEYVAPNQR